MLKKIIIFFVALFSIELINVGGRVSKEFLANKKITGEGEFTIGEKHPILYGYYEGDTFQFYETTTETDELEVEMFVASGDDSWNAEGNFCDIISYEGTDDKMEKQREFVKLLGITKCPIERGNYTLLKFGNPDPDVIAILVDEPDATFEGVMNLFKNGIWAIQYSYKIKVES